MVFAAAQAVFLFTFPRLLRCTTNLIEFYGIKPTQCSSGISTSRHAPGVQAFDAFKLRSLRSNSLERDHRPVQWLTPESICIRQIWSCQSQRYRFIKESYLYAAFLYLPGVPALTRFVRAPRFCSKRKLPCCVGVASEGARDRLIFVIPLGFERKVWGSTTADDTMEITVQSNHAINRLYMIVRWGWVVGLQEMGRATKGIKLPFIKRHIWHFGGKQRTLGKESYYLANGTDLES